MCVNNLPRVALDSGEARIRYVTCWSQVQRPLGLRVTPLITAFSFKSSFDTHARRPIRSDPIATWIRVGIGSSKYVAEHPGVGHVQVAVVDDDLLLVVRAEWTDVSHDFDAGEQTGLVLLSTDARRDVARVRHQVVVRQIEPSAATNIDVLFGRVGVPRLEFGGGQKWTSGVNDQ